MSDIGYVFVLICILAIVPIKWLVKDKIEKKKVTSKQKSFSSKKEGGIFTGNDYETEKKTMSSIAALFAGVVRCDDNKIMKPEVLVAYEYFEKRFSLGKDWFRLIYLLMTKQIDFFDLFTSDEDKIRSSFDSYLKSKKIPNYIDCALDVLKAKVPYEARLELLDYLFKTAYAYQGICEQEIQRLRNIAKYLVIKDWDLLSLEYKYEYRKMESGKSQSDERTEESKKRVDDLSDTLMRHAYSVLGIPSDATDEEVKTAYREIVKVCHPDKLTVPEGSKEWEESVVRFRQTNEAYELVCGKRGMA